MYFFFEACAFEFLLWKIIYSMSMNPAVPIFTFYELIGLRLILSIVAISMGILFLTKPDPKNYYLYRIQIISTIIVLLSLFLLFTTNAVIQTSNLYKLLTNPECHHGYFEIIGNIFFWFYRILGMGFFPIGHICIKK
jgi:hypothetical protein